VSVSQHEFGSPITDFYDSNDLDAMKTCSYRSDSGTSKCPNSSEAFCEGFFCAARSVHKLENILRAVFRLEILLSSTDRYEIALRNISELSKDEIVEGLLKIVEKNVEYNETERPPSLLGELKEHLVRHLKGRLQLSRNTWLDAIKALWYPKEYNHDIITLDQGHLPLTRLKIDRMATRDPGTIEDEDYATSVIVYLVGLASALPDDVDGYAKEDLNVFIDEIIGHFPSANDVDTEVLAKMTRKIHNAIQVLYSILPKNICKVHQECMMQNEGRPTPIETIGKYKKNAWKFQKSISRRDEQPATD